MRPSKRCRILKLENQRSGAEPGEVEPELELEACAACAGHFWWIPPATALILLTALLWGLAVPQPTHAAPHAAPVHQELQSYTVVAGDTLAAIAERYGVSLEALVELNNIADASLINVGQELLIPAPGSDAADAIVQQLSTIPTVSARAKPGETLLSLSRRLAQDAAVLAALNGISETERLFPGEVVKIPADAVGGDAFNPLRFGSVANVTVPDVLVQGRTGHLLVETTRPLSLTATWNGLPLGFTEVSGANAETANHLVHALLPVPALLAPTLYPVVITYTASNGTLLDRTWFVNVVEGVYETQDIILPPDKGGLLEPEIAEAEEEKVYAVWSQFTPELRWTGVFSRPISVEYPTTSPYGTRRSYNSGPVASYHAGQDFGAPEGVPILAPADGVVALAEPLDIRGNAVILDHGGGIFSGYWHMVEMKVAPGQEVRTGDVLGLVGTTGLSTGAHLHWELRIYTIAVDPIQFLADPLLSLN